MGVDWSIRATSLQRFTVSKLLPVLLLVSVAIPQPIFSLSPNFSLHVDILLLLRHHLDDHNIIELFHGFSDRKRSWHENANEDIGTLFRA
jgi:hypothetical protein